MKIGSKDLCSTSAKSLADAETRYSHLEQAALALRVAAKKLRPYFQVHPIVILTYLPIWSTIHRPDLSRRMARWAVELSEYGIQYKPRLSKNGQVLVDFIEELPQSETCPNNLDWWTLNIDRASRQSGAGIGLQLRTPSGDKIEQSIRLGFNASNNESEYEAILVGLELATAVSCQQTLDSERLSIGGRASSRRIRVPRPPNGKIRLSGKTTLEQLFGLEAGARPQGL